MLKLLTKLIFFVILCLSSIWPQPARSQCRTLPDPVAMNHSFLSYLKNLAPHQKDTIAIMPFYDNHAGFPDPRLQHGIPMIIYDLYSPHNQKILHPFVSFYEAEKMAMVSQELFQMQSAEKMAQSLGTRFVVFGSYQITSHESIKMNINLYDHKTKETLSPVSATESHFNDLFFTELVKTLQNAFSRHPSATKLKEPQSPLPTLETFLSYAKGIPLSRYYNQTNLELAALWFEKALQQSHQKYEDAALNLSRTWHMLALLKNLHKKDGSLDTAKANQAFLFAKDHSSVKNQKYQLVTRFLQAQNHARNAIHAYSAKNTDEAKKQALDGLKLLPEDGFLQNLYLQASGGKMDREVELNHPICF